MPPIRKNMYFNVYLHIFKLEINKNPYILKCEKTLKFLSALCAYYVNAQGSKEVDSLKPFNVLKQNIPIWMKRTLTQT